MSKKQSFEKSVRQKLSELPLPNEDESWRKMEALLDKRKKRRPFLFFKNEKITGGMLLFICLWMMLWPGNSKKQEAPVAARNNVAGNKKLHQDEKETTNRNSFSENKMIQQKDSSSNTRLTEQVQTNRENMSTRNISTDRNKQANVSNKQSLKKESRLIVDNLNKKEAKDNRIKGDNADVAMGSNNFMQQDSNKHDDTATVRDTAGTIMSSSKDKQAAQNKTDNGVPPLLIAKNNQQQTVSNNASAKKENIIKPPRHYTVAAGIGLQQQIPVNGQKFVFYNYKGSKAILPDYIPSVYVKLEKNNQWFLQGEFRYASPHLTKAFTYQQKTRADYNHGSITINTNRLQKTFYTEVPLSFNLYMHRSRWVVGAGAEYSWLHGAIVTKETVVNNIQSGVQTIEKQVLPIRGFTDSFFYKTKAGILLQTAYNKNRWYLGLRYIQDLQPYLTYTMPNGLKKDKRNASVEFLIQYRLFHLPISR